MREVSTEIDESTHRADILVHFLRKQSHVESSARVVDFIEGVINFWLTKDKAPLQEFLHEHIYQQVKSSGSYIHELHIIFNNIFLQKRISDVTDLLHLKDDEILALTHKATDVSEREKRRAYLAVKFYQLLYRKYKLDPQDIKDQLIHAQSLGLPSVDSLIKVLEQGKISQRLEGVLDYLGLLKRTVGERPPVVVASGVGASGAGEETGEAAAAAENLEVDQPIDLKLPRQLPLGSGEVALRYDAIRHQPQQADRQ